jgi:XdhC and CoxI family
MTVVAGRVGTIHLIRDEPEGRGRQTAIEYALPDTHYPLLAVTMEVHMLARDEDILRAAEEWRAKGRRVALATVVETWGSAPRPVGSNLVIDDEGNFLGSVSGGCVEGAVVTEALDVIESGKPKTLEFGVADETAWKVGLSCGGTIRVYLEKVE